MNLVAVIGPINTHYLIEDIQNALDTHGVNHMNFALLDLFGYTFALRYACIGDLAEKMSHIKTEGDDTLKLSLKKKINKDIIIEHQEDIQRIALTLKEEK